MKEKTKHILKIITRLLMTVFLIIVLFVIYILDSNYYDNTVLNPIMKYSMTSITLEWGRFSPFPKTKTNFKIQTEGNSFTRSFRCSFYVPKEDLIKWMENSPCFKDAKIEKLDKNKNKYIIEPEGKAGYAEAIIDFTKNYVTIYVCWS